ncbi:GTP cyclohydrolase II [Phaeodactylibacter luteus]|uniref:GTP cyclohydrolase-2 n=1 Tax=Phaeodactylibacter luteus TaxID=1564516 RepID=A0A5C6RGX2_9BACT|nr:GTP cyclohydrolase II [Phaeodactylibacter luteus]TXB61304.1 GTP cyclohydrolase II [Phaeodactylibacter luteus]
MTNPDIHTSKGRLVQQAEAMIPTPWGNFNMVAFAEKESDWMPHLALVHESMDPAKPVLVRIHSECITGDLFGSKRCDCGEQLAEALSLAAEHGGMVLYLRQEGRGIGIINKLKAYNLQDKGLNTIDANLHLGLEIDARQYDIAIDMLKALGIRQINLLTNNPEKIEAFENAEVEVLSRVPLIIKPKKENFEYLKTKQDEMGHLFKL